MKNSALFFTLLFLVGTLSLSAQIQEKSLLIGGNANLGTTFANGSSTTNLTLNPTIGTFISDAFAIGGTLTLGFASVSDISIWSYGLSPFARYYFKSEQSTPRAFILGEVGFLGVSASGDSQTGFTARFGPGLDIFLNDSVALEGILGLNVVDFGDDAPTTTNIGVSFGVQVFLQRQNDN